MQDRRRLRFVRPLVFEALCFGDCELASTSECRVPADGKIFLWVRVNQLVSVLVTKEMSGCGTLSSLRLEKKPVTNVKQVILPPFVSVETAEILTF